MDIGIEEQAEHAVRSLHLVTITLRKHSATIEWPECSGICAAGRLTIHTEDPLAEDQDARFKAHEALYALARLIEAGVSSVSWQELEAGGNLPMTTSEEPPGEDDTNPLDGTLIGA